MKLQITQFYSVLKLVMVENEDIEKPILSPEDEELLERTKGMDSEVFTESITRTKKASDAEPKFGKIKLHKSPIDGSFVSRSGKIMMSKKVGN